MHYSTHTFGETYIASIFNMPLFHSNPPVRTFRVPDVHVNQVIFHSIVYPKICQQEKFLNDVRIL